MLDQETKVYTRKELERRGLGAKLGVGSELLGMIDPNRVIYSPPLPESTTDPIGALEAAGDMNIEGGKVTAEWDFPKNSRRASGYTLRVTFETFPTKGE